jgi:hypothetical protein
MKRVQIVGLSLSGLLAGNELRTLIGLHPAMRTLPLDREIESEQALTGYLARIMPVYTTATLIAVGAAAVDRLGRRGFPSTLGAASAIAAMPAVTRLGNMPLNRQTMSYPAGGDAAGWRAIRRRWERLHTVRVVLDLAAFGCLTAAAFQDSQRSS